MKKMIIALLCAMLLCLALQPVVLAASESIDIDVDGQPLTLMFDASNQFSYISGGNVQASFYTYLDGSNDLYELYMIFPEEVQSGSRVDTAYAIQNAPDACVVMIVTTAEGVNYYFAGQAESTDGTDFTMVFDSVADSDAGRTYSGTLSASMVGIAAETDLEVNPLSIQNARFSFTMPASAGDSSDDGDDAAAPGNEDEPFDDDYDPFANPSPAPSREVFRV